MKRRVVKGMVLALCLTMLAPAASMLVPGAQMVVSAEELPAEPPEKSDTENPLDTEKKEAKDVLIKWKNDNLIENDPRAEEVENIITNANKEIDDAINSADVGVKLNDAIRRFNELSPIINPPIIDDSSDYDDSDDDNTDEEEDTTVTPDHFLMVGGDWVTPVANAGQSVNIVQIGRAHV